MNLDFEAFLRRQSVRPIPAEWRAEILRAAQAKPASSPCWRNWLHAWGRYEMDLTRLPARRRLRRLELAAELLAACFGRPVLQWVLPASWLAHIGMFFQYSSVTLAELLFRMAGDPVVRDGLNLRMPGFNLRWAPECGCGGDDWTLMLLVACLLAGYGRLRRFWSRAALVLAVIPLVIVRNGLRAFMIGCYSIHISPHVFVSPASIYDGPLFLALSLIPLYFLLTLLRKHDAKVPPVT